MALCVGEICQPQNHLDKIRSCLCVRIAVLRVLLRKAQLKVAMLLCMVRVAV
jgi:hypothetical protein